MKKLVIAMMLVSSSYASVIKICAVQANEICKELQGKDFQDCHRFQMDMCLDYYNGGEFKSAKSCDEVCWLIESPSERKACLQECSEF